MARAPPPKEQCNADEVRRVRADVVEKARQFNDETGGVWQFRHAIPAETNGWVYIGDGGALAVSDYWVDELEDPDVGWTVNVDERRAAVSFTADMDEKARSKREIHRVDAPGDDQDAGLVERRRMFWQAVEWLLEFLRENPPGDVTLEAVGMTACDSCQYTDVRKPGTDCPICEDGVMATGE